MLVEAEKVMTQQLISPSSTSPRPLLAFFFCYKSHFVNVTAKPNKILFHSKTRCLKITEKVSFNIASEASYVYIMSGQKFIKNAKNWTILASF